MSFFMIIIVFTYACSLILAKISFVRTAGRTFIALCSLSQGTLELRDEDEGS